MSAHNHDMTMQVLTLTNSFPRFCSVPRAWFLNTTSSSHLRLTWKAFEFSKGLPRAISSSRSSCSFAAFSASYTDLAQPYGQAQITTYLSGLLLCAFSFDLFEFPHQLRRFVFLVVIALFFTAFIVSHIRISVDVSCLLQDAPPLRLKIFVLDIPCWCL